jgi:hypothetical protein
MTITLHRTVEITVGLPPDQAMALFTPEGERRWAEGWNPHYPVPDRREGAGAVFTTAHGGRLTTWIMIDRDPEMIRYARVTNDMTAGTVAVEICGSGESATNLRVSYDLTALSTHGEAWLDAFDAGYDAEIAAWATAIAAAVPGGPLAPTGGS